MIITAVITIIIIIRACDRLTVCLSGPFSASSCASAAASELLPCCSCCEEADCREQRLQPSSKNLCSLSTKMLLSDDVFGWDCKLHNASAEPNPAHKQLCTFGLS